MIKLIVQSLRGCFKTCDPNILGIQSIKSMKNIERLNSLTRLDKNTKSAEKKSAKEKHKNFLFFTLNKKKVQIIIISVFSLFCSHQFAPIDSLVLWKRWILMWTFLDGCWASKDFENIRKYLNSSKSQFPIPFNSCNSIKMN